MPALGRNLVGSRMQCSCMHVYHLIIALDLVFVLHSEHPFNILALHLVKDSQFEVHCLICVRHLIVIRQHLALCVVKTVCHILLGT